MKQKLINLILALALLGQLDLGLRADSQGDAMTDDFDHCFDCGARTEYKEDGVRCPECGWRPVRVVRAATAWEVEDDDEG